MHFYKGMRLKPVKFLFNFFPIYKIRLRYITNLLYYFKYYKNSDLCIGSLTIILPSLKLPGMSKTSAIGTGTSDGPVCVGILNDLSKITKVNIARYKFKKCVGSAWMCRK